MALEPGKLSYICLAATFDKPRWRQTAVVNISQDWVKVVVRAKRVGEVADHFTTFSLDGKTYFLAEVRRHQLQAFHEGDCLDLAMDVSALVSQGKTLVESDEDVTYATASDTHRAPPAGRDRRPKPDPESSSDSGSEESDLDVTLGRLKKSWLGEDIKSEKETSKPKTKGRYPMLQESKAEKASGSKESPLQEALLRSLKKGGDPLQAMLAMQMLEKFEKKRHNRRSRSQSSSKSSSGFNIQRRVKSSPASNQRTCSSHRRVPGISQKDAEEASSLHQAVHQRGGGRTWCGRGQTLYPPRLREEDLMGKATVTSADALPSFGDSDAATAEEIRKSWVANNARFTCPSPNGTRPRRLELELDVDTSAKCLGSKTMGRICGGIGECGLLPAFYGGTQQECGKGPKCSVSRSTKSSRCSKSPQTWKRGKRSKGQRKRKRLEGQDRGQDGELKSHQLKVKPSCAKPLEVNSVLEALRTGHGSFSRFLKILQEEPFLHGSGPMTSPVHNKEKPCLFPSLLVIPKRCYSKSSRGRSRARGREYTWEHVRVLWAFFTFLEGGSPFRYQDQVSLAEKACSNPWTAMHQEYAGFLHDQVLNFDRLECSDTLGRGLEQLEKFVTTIKNSSYQPGPFEVHENISSAMDVRPDRMSLPDIAGIIDPADHLKGEHLSSFNNILQEVPHDCPPPQPTKGCFKVKREEVVEVYRKLLDSGAATLIPQRTCS